MGQYRINQLPLKTKAQALKYLDEEKWNIIFQISYIIQEQMLKKATS